MLVTEMLLRKTRAESVEPIVTELFRCHPDLPSLAQADIAELEGLLRPLGLHRIRARAIMEVSRRLLAERGGQVPEDYEALLSLPHVGRYVANAVLLFAFGQPRPIVDANVVRLFERYFRIPRPIEVHKADPLWELAERLTPAEQPEAFAWGMLDLGAAVCTPRRPACGRCPLRHACWAFNAGAVEPSM